MILSPLDKALQYACSHPGLLQGIQFLQETVFDSLADGKHEIDGQRLVAICAHDQGRGRDGAVLEVHRKFIDIQYVVSGSEFIGWKPLGDCRELKQDYNPETDLQFFSDRPPSWFEVAPHSFAIFFPEDAHAPLGGLGSVHKIVIKVAVTQ